MKVYLRTFGCRANQYDSESVRALLAEGGATLVPAPAEADVAVFNSCAVTGEAEADLRREVRRSARQRPGLRSLVMGCAVRPGDASGLASLPGVERVVQGADLAALADALALPPVVALARASRQSGTRALLRIQDGCDEHCTFCATRLARGAARSRPMADLVDEARRLAERHPEIVLTGVHIGAYGHDIGSSLGALVAELARCLTSTRLRLSSVEATELDPTLVALLRDGGIVAPHLHAPLQSGSDRVLRRMGRHWYTAATYAAAVERLTRDRAVFALGADVIAGFPGETEADHAATMALVDALPFTYLHVFPYSERPGTAAARLGSRVPAEVVARRARELRDLAGTKASAYRRARAGGSADVVVIGSGVRREGLTEDFLTVQMDPDVPRGSRMRARLRMAGERLLATGLSAKFQ